MDTGATRGARRLHGDTGPIDRTIVDVVEGYAITREDLRKGACPRCGKQPWECTCALEESKGVKNEGG